MAQAKAENFMYAEEYPPEYWKELYEKTSTNIREEVFSGREEEERTGTNIWRRRGRLMNGKVDKEV